MKGSDVLVSMYWFEEIFYKSNNVYATDFLLLSENEFLNMEIEASHNSDSVCGFVYYRQNMDVPYVDVYIWDVMLEGGYKRFVITEGYSFCKEDERIFLDYMSGKIVFETDAIQRLTELVKRDYKEIHLKSYSEPCHILLHIYFTFHRNGIYEILFKSNLNWIAVNLDKIEDYNIIGGSPQEIFSTHIEVLRALNYKEGIDNLVKLPDREMLNTVYSEFHNYIRKKKVNKYQLNYLKDICVKGEKIDRKLYLFLGKLWDDSQYYAYLKYREYKQVVDDYYPILPKYPALCELKEMCEICDRIEGYIENEIYYDRKYAMHFYDIKRNYQYENDKYVMVVPDRISDILEEAAKQHNCLYSYVWKVASGYTTILFMRDKANRSKSLITIEVQNGILKQAYRAFNKIPNEQEQKFIEEFAKEKNLEVDIDYDEEVDLWIEEEDEAV